MAKAKRQNQRKRLKEPVKQPARTERTLDVVRLSSITLQLDHVTNLVHCSVEGELGEENPDKEFTPGDPRTPVATEFIIPPDDDTILDAVNKAVEALEDYVAEAPVRGPRG